MHLRADGISRGTMSVAAVLAKSKTSLIADWRLRTNLQVTIFGTFRKNLDVLDFSVLLPYVVIIADEADALLTQRVTRYTKVLSSKVWKAQVA
jgi:hypothetical protein